MANYDFQTLNNKVFEELVRDLLDAKYALGYKVSKRGRTKE